MAVALRLKRFGTTSRPFYRVAALDKRKKRDGAVLEELGWFNPLLTDPAKQVNINLDRCRYWLSVGAQPSDTVRTLLKRQGVVMKPKPGTRVKKY